MQLRPFILNWTEQISAILPLRAVLLPQLNDIKTNGDKVREKTAEIKRYRQVIRKAVLL